MTTKHFWKSLLMSAVLLVSGAMISCENEDEVSDFTAQISTSISSKSVEAGEEVNFTVTSNTKWTATIEDPNGILELSKTAGGSGETAVKAYISQNAADGNRATVTFTAMGYAFGYEIPVSQKVVFGVGSLTPATGSGTLEDPFTAAGANAKAKELASGETSAESYFIKGVVTSVKEAYTTQYGNGTFYIGETQDASETFYIYRAYYLDNKKYSSESDPNVEVGDEVVIYGKICNYNGTLETAQNGAYLYMLNGVGGGEVPSEDPVEVTPGEYYMFGKLDSDSNGTSLAPYIYHAWDGTLNTSGTSNYLTTVSYSSDDEKTFSLNPANSGSAAKVEIAAVSGKEGFYTIKCNGQYLYTTEASKNHTLALGDDASKAEWAFKEYSKGGVVATNNGNTLGTGSATRNFLRSYANETQPAFGLLFCKVSETTLDGESSGGGETTEPTEYTVATVAEFNAAEESATTVYQLEGTISGSINTTYGNFDLVDDTGTVYVYGLTKTYLGYNSTNDKSYASLGLVSGDKIRIRGYRGSFNGKIEVMYAWFIEKLEGGNQGGGDESGDDANMITRIADLKAGTYYLAGYSESYNTTTYAPYSYHAWTGTISSNGDLNTVNYQYDATAKSLTLNPNLSSQDAAKGTAVKVELVSAGENTYYIKYNNQYLYSTQADTNRKMGLTDTATAWTFSNHDKGGLSILNNGVILGTGGATYDLLRSYKTPANSLVYGIALIAESVTVNNNGDSGNQGGNQGGGDEGGGDEDGDYKLVTTAPASWAGEYIIGYANGTTLYTLNEKYSGETATRSTFTYATTDNYNGSSISGTTFKTVTFEAVGDKYAIKYGSMYVGWTSSTGNSCEFTATAPTASNTDYLWTLSVGSDGTAQITNVGTAARRLQFNANNGQERFAIYGGTQKDVLLFAVGSGDSGNTGGGNTGGGTETPTGGTATIDLKETGVSGSAYVTSAQTFTIDGISYTAHNFNPTSGQVRGNQTSATSNFYINNNTAYSGKIKTVTMKTGATDTAKFQNNCYCATGSEAIATPAGSGTAGTISADGKSITWNLNSSDSYFMISTKEKFTNGSATAVVITVEYE